MRTVSLEKQIAGIINDGQVLRSEEYRMCGETVEIKTIKEGNFKCTVPMGYMQELLANARRMSRKNLKNIRSLKRKTFWHSFPIIAK